MPRVYPAPSEEVETSSNAAETEPETGVNKDLKHTVVDETENHQNNEDNNALDEEKQSKKKRKRAKGTRKQLDKNNDSTSSPVADTDEKSHKSTLFRGHGQWAGRTSRLHSTQP